jgi:hypothetical protein
MYCYKQVVGIFVIRRDDITNPSFRDIESLYYINEQKLGIDPLVLFLITIPDSKKESWIFTMSYNCYLLPPNSRYE